jgi:acyl-coenzyme A synthetase/AMP-(fatty) acid ligase
MRRDLDLADIFASAQFQAGFKIASPMVAGQSAEALTGTPLVQCIWQAAAALQRSGLRAGDSLLIQAPQSSEAFVLFWAAMQIGAVFVPVDATWPEYLLARATQDLSPKLVVATPGCVDSCRRCFPAALLVLIGDGRMSTAAATQCWDDWLTGNAGAPVASAPVAQGGDPGRHDPAAAAAYLFTSGSTGVPKAVILSRSALAHGAAVTLSSFAWRPGERLLNLPEPHTMSGLRNAFVAAPWAGLTWIPAPVEQRANVFALIELIRDSSCSHLVAGPALVRHLVLLGERLEAADLAQLAAIYCTGATLNVASAQTFFTRYGIPIVNYYGLTETGGICLSQSRQGWDPADTSLGMAVGCTARLVPIDGSAATDHGELQIRSPQLMSGYLNDPQRTAARLDDGWLRTGDIMRRDPAGRYHLLGRAELFIKTASTERIHPEELEAVLEQHDAVTDAAVVGMTNEQDIERVIALVVLRNGIAGSGALASELARFVASRLGDGRAPNDVRFVTNLPRLASGKLARQHLMEMIG